MGFRRLQSPLLCDISLLESPLPMHIGGFLAFPVSLNKTMFTLLVQNVFEFPCGDATPGPAQCSLLCRNDCVRTTWNEDIEVDMESE